MDYENLIRQYFILKYPHYVCLEKRIKITIIAFFPILKKTPKRDLELMLKNKISPTKKPDIDNIAKAILDSLNGIAFKDDNQITKLDIEKKYSTTEKIYIRIEEY